jgi:hypothetical protein
MKKINFLFSFFTTLSYSVLLAQVNANGKDFVIAEKPEIETHKKSPEKLMGIDFHCWGTSFHYAVKVKKFPFLGFEIGAFPDKFDWVLVAGKYITQENTPWSQDKSWVHINNINQIIFLHFFTRWKPESEWFELDGGLRWAGYSRSGYYHTGEGIDDIGWTRLLGCYLKPSIGVKRLKVGTRLEIGYMDRHINEFVLMVSPFFRFNFNAKIQ